MTYPNQIYSASAFTGFLMCAIPLYWHLEASNVGTSLYMIWVGLGCLNFFINSVVWNSSVQNFAPVWCDISSRFLVGLNVGMPAALLVINHRLFKIASRTAARTTRAEKRRVLFIDLAIGLGIPLVQMLLQLVVEGHRFDIFEEIGCLPNTYNVTLAFPLVWVWAPILGIISAIYCLLTIRIFWKSSQQLKEIQGSNKSPNHSRYMRLIALSATQILIGLPIALYFLYVNAHIVPVSPWISWEDTHFNYSRVTQTPSVEWRASSILLVTTEITRWAQILCALLFFAFFGFAEEARKHYRIAYSFATSRLHLGNFGTKSASTSSRSSKSSFGTGIRNALSSFKGGFAPLGSRRGPESTIQHKALSSTSVSEYRLTSDDSVFEGVEAQLKAFGVASENPTHPAPPLTAVITLPTASPFPAPPPPNAVLSIPPNRLNSPLPHRPASSFLDNSEKV